MFLSPAPSSLHQSLELEPSRSTLTHLSLHSSMFTLPLPKRDFVDGSSDWRLYWYFITQIIGGILLSILLVTMIRPSKPRRPRNPLLISLCFSWWISTFPCLLILYYTNTVSGPAPDQATCLASAVLTMAQTVLVATTAPALVFNIWLIVKSAVTTTFDDARWTTWSTWLCLGLPYVFFVIYGLATLASGLAHPERVHRAVFYCIVDDVGLEDAISALGTIAMITAIIFEVWTVILLRQNRSRLKQLSKEGRNLLDISLVIRVCLFGLYVFFGLCLNVVAIVDWANPIPDLFFCTFGIAVFLIFGSQRDIWQTWSNTVSRHLSSAGHHSLSKHSQPFSPITPGPGTGHPSEAFPSFSFPFSGRASQSHHSQAQSHSVHTHSAHDLHRRSGSASGGMSSGRSKKGKRNDLVINLPPPPVPSKTPIRDAYPVSRSEITIVDRSLPPTPTPFLHTTVPYDYSATPTHPTFAFDSPTDASHQNQNQPSPYIRPFAHANSNRDTPSPGGSSWHGRTKSLSWTLNKLAQGSISSLSSIRRSLTPSILLDTAYPSRSVTPHHGPSHSPQHSSGGSGGIDLKRSRSPRSPSRVYFPSATSPDGKGVDIQRYIEDGPHPESPSKNPPPTSHSSQSVDLSAYDIEMDSFDIERDLAPGGYGYHEKEFSPLPTPKTFDSFILPQSVRPSLDTDSHSHSENDAKSERTVKGRKSEREEEVERPLPRRSES